MKKKGENVYFVKDNGAGFDMRSRDRLFGAFQRLHGEDEFKGSGMGLAIVKQARRAPWGAGLARQGSVGSGATFYVRDTTQRFILLGLSSCAACLIPLGVNPRFCRGFVTRSGRLPEGIAPPPEHCPSTSIPQNKVTIEQALPFLERGTSSQE